MRTATFLKWISVVLLPSLPLLVGCGESKKEVAEQTIRDYYDGKQEETGFIRFGGKDTPTVPHSIIRCPSGLQLDSSAKEPGLETVRVTAVGKRYESAWDGHPRWPIKAYIKGTCLVKLVEVETPPSEKGSLFPIGLVKSRREARVPFEGEVEFTLEWIPPDKTKVSSQGRWAVHPQ